MHQKSRKPGGGGVPGAADGQESAVGRKGDRAGDAPHIKAGVEVDLPFHARFRVVNNQPVACNKACACVCVCEMRLYVVNMYLF